MKRIFIPLTILALTALALAAAGGAGEKRHGTIIALKASSAFPGAKGKAKFQTEGQRELEIEVEHVRRLAGKRVNFFVGATKVGSARDQRARRGADRPPRRRASRRSAQARGSRSRPPRGKLIVSGSF